jgi:hypothetical protein
MSTQTSRLDGSLTRDKVFADMSEVLGTVAYETLLSLIFMDTSMILRVVAGPMLRHTFEYYPSPHRRSPYSTELCGPSCH